MIKILKNKLILSSIIVLTSLFGIGQNMPTSATVIMTPPHPVYLNDYYAIGSNAFQTILSLNDLNEPSWDVRLKVTIEGEGIKITTKPTYIPLSPISLTAGVPLIFQGGDFASYLDVNNVDLEGITATSLNQSGKLPEGLYEFCVEILDYNTGTPLSLTSCATVFIFFEPPPVTLQPACEDVVTPMEPQNLYFTWQIAGGASPTIAINSKYKFFLYEITSETDDPYFAVQNNHALLVYESEFIDQTSLSIDFGITTTTMLTPGKRYAYRVRAVDGDEKNIYRNDGYSEWCWFYYGYPSNGHIAITSPEDEHVFGKFENKSFNWSSSDLGVPGQEYEYIITIKELNSGQEKEVAMDNNPEWHNEIMPISTSLSGYGLNLQKEFETGKTYVWQVRAFTGIQEVAKSDIYTYYAPSLMDQFYAGNNIVKIVSLSGADLTDVSGIGKVQLSEDELDVVEFEFEHLNIEDMNGDMILVSGEAEIDLGSRTSMKLDPEVAENGQAEFEFSSAVINSTGLKLKGQIKWQFPHATTDGSVAYLNSKEEVFTINSNYQIVGESTIEEATEYELLEPYEFKLSLTESASFILRDGKYALGLNGHFVANDNVKTDDGNPYKLTFSNQPSMYYFEATGLLDNATNFIQPIDGLGIGFMPKKAIIDLSEEQSPEKVSGMPTWKGMYFPQYKTRFSAGSIDATSQFKIASDIDFEDDLSNSEFWLTNQGLHLDYEFELENDGITFNGFTTTVSGNLEIDDNQVTSSKMTGEIGIPVIHKTDKFGFEIPITNDGLNQGYLNEDLTLRELIFNPFGGENRVNITINRAVFADNERLDLEIDAELVGISATVSGISDFRIYGDNTIGIGERNGSADLDTQVEGTYKGFAAFVQKVGASMFNGNYVFSYVAAMDLGDDVVGEDGPPLMAISSVEQVGSDVDLPTYSPSNPQPTPQITVPTDIEEGASTLTTQEMYVSVDNALVEIDGYLKLTSNDPNWGTSFQGGIDGAIKIPARIEVGSHMILGDRDGVKFWYFDAYFNDREGLGIQVPPFFNVVAMEGRMFHHMSKNETEYVVDPDMAFGAGLYLQLIDNAQQGALFAIDAGAEIKIQENGDFTLSVSGDGSFLNTNRRSAVSGSVSGAVGEELVNEALEAIGPLELSFDVGGGTLAVKAEGLTSGSMNYTKGDLELGFGADMGGTPGIAFKYGQGGNSFTFNADAGGTFGVGMGIDGYELGLGLRGSSGAYLDFAFGDASFSTSINRADKSGSLAFGYGDKSIGFGIGKTGGSMNLSLSSTSSFETGFSTTGSAHLGFVSGSNEFRISGDKSEGSGSLDLKVDGLSMNLAANVTEKSASFGFDAGGVALDVAAAANKSASFDLKQGTNEYGIGIDIESKSGHLNYKYDGGNKQFYAAVKDGEEGELLFKNGTKEFSLSGNSEGTAGSLSLKDGEDEFSIAADKSAGTGSLTFALDGNSISTSVKSDTGGVAFKYNGVEFAAGITSSGSGGLTFKEGSNAIALYGNPENESGSLKVVHGSDEYFAATNLQNNEHNLKVVTGSQLYQLDYSESNKLVKYKNGDSFEIYAQQTSSDYEVGTTVSDHSIVASVEGGISSISYEGMGTVVTLSEDYVEVTYSNETIKVAESGVTLNGSTLSEIANNASFDVSKDLGDLSVGLSANSGNYAVEFNKGGNKIAVSTESFNDGQVEVTYNGNKYAVAKEGSAYSVGYNDLSATYDDGSIELKKGTDKSLEISSEEVSLTYDSYEFSVSETAFAYSDGDNEVEIAADKFKIKKGDKSLYIEEDGAGLDYGSSKHVYLTKTSADFKYDSYEAGFVKNESVSLTDGTRSLSLSNNGLSVSDGNRSLALLDNDGKPSVKLTNNNDFFEVGTTGFAIEYQNKRYAINENENLNIEIDDSRYIEIMDNGAKYVEGSTELIIGGDDNFLELKDDDLSIALTQDEKLTFVDGDYQASLSKDLEVMVTDGSKTLGLFTDTHYVNYAQEGYSFGIRNGKSGGKPGIDVTANGHTVYVEGERNKDVTVGVESTDFGKASFTVNSSKDITARFENAGSVYGFIKKGSTITPITGSEPEPPVPQYLDGAGSVVAMDGPVHLTNSVAEDAGGSIRGKAEISFDSKNKRLVANAAVKGNSPVCIEGAMALDASPSNFKLNIGTEQERIEIYPTCSGFGGGGWFGLESNSTATTVDIGVFVGWRASAGVEIGSDVIGAGLSVEASAELGVKAKAEIYPDFSIKEAAIWLELYAAIKAKYWAVGVSGSCTIASISLRGELMARFHDTYTQVAGTLSGEITVLDIISAGFDMGFNTSF